MGHPQVQLFSGVREIEEHRLKPVLLVFLVDVEDGAVFVEGYVEGFGFFYEDVSELVFLG